MDTNWVFGMPKEKPCDCACHNDGTAFRHFITCCKHEGQKYRNADGTLDQARWKEVNK